MREQNMNIKDIFSGIKGEILFGDEIADRLCTDFIGSHVGHADVYIKAKDRDDIVSALKTASANAISVVIRGAGTNLVGSTIPDGGLILDVSGLNRILELDRERMSITVEPGVILKDLIAYVEERGFFYPPDPAEKDASIGGNVATNAGGMRAVKYGVTRDYVLQLELVTVNGEILTLGANTRKNAAGLNLQKIVVGSEGTLGVITKITLKLLPLPESTLSAILAYDSLSEAISSVNAILNANLDPTAIEFLEKRVIAFGERYLGKEFPVPQAKAYLIVTFDGQKQSVLERIEKCSNVVKQHGAIEVVSLAEPELAALVWEIRGALAKSVQASGVWEPVDTVVPLNRISDFVSEVNRISQQLHVRILGFGHAGDGNVHLCIIKDDISDADWPEVLDKAMSLCYQKAYELGGLASAEHGIGKTKRKYFLEHTDPAVRNIMIGVKKAFDEQNLLNPQNGYAA